ncbi:hypothetical protein LAZ67_1002466 [Cordylochernes scorpioides]|uniref:rRNA 2'-O-methyltransferase fibrillarin n=1 Tax=Cordylochernes scorpioides TaxID=51811 RepID=A0ABY6JW46_9ARAC|nr:hypothetical protein LAZ67_1002466 [Cordylochernes scorpioides]
MNPVPQEARMGLRGLTTRKAYSSRPKKKVEGKAHRANVVLSNHQPCVPQLEEVEDVAAESSVEEEEVVVQGSAVVAEDPALGSVGVEVAEDSVVDVEEPALGSVEAVVEVSPVVAEVAVVGEVGAVEDPQEVIPLQRIDPDIEHPLHGITVILSPKTTNKKKVQPHRLENIYIKKGKSDALCTKSIAPGVRVYGEKRIVEEENGEKVEYREWNPFRSKLAAAIVNGVENIYIKPGSKVLYLGAASGTTVSHVSDLVGKDGMVYAVEFSERCGRDLITVAQRQRNIVPLIMDARQPAKYGAFVCE